MTRPGPPAPMNRVPAAPAVPTPYLTYLLIALNVATFAITVKQSGSLEDNADHSALFLDWALYPPAVAHGQWLRIVGSAFLHFGPMHLAFNMFALYVLGRFVEASLGSARFLSLYVVSMLGSAAAVMALSQNGLTAGASGAIYGLFGVQVAILLRVRQSPGPALAVIFLNLVISVSIPHISLWGHLGGLIAGSAAGVGMLFAPVWFARSPESARAVSWAAPVVVGVVALCVIAYEIARLG